MEFTSSGIRVGLQHFLAVVLVIQLDFESPLSVEIDLILLVPQQRHFMFFFFHLATGNFTNRCSSQNGDMTKWSYKESCFCEKRSLRQEFRHKVYKSLILIYSNPRLFETLYITQLE